MVACQAAPDCERSALNSFLLAIASFIVVTLTALIAIPPLIDWNDYRGIFEEEVSRLFGRDVRVRGDVTLRILPQPFLSFEEVQIAEEPGVTGEPFLRADGFMIRLSVPPLLRGVIEAKNVVLQRPRVRLRIDENGRGSWQQLRFTEGALGFAPNDVALKAVDITDGEVTFEGPNRDVLGRISDVSGQLNAAALRGPYKFVGSLKWRGEPNDLRISTGTFDPNEELVPAKIVIRSRDGFSSLTVDGLVRQVPGQVPELTGDVTAQTRLNVAGDAPQTQTPALQQVPLPGNRIEGRAKLRLNAHRFALDDILVSFDQSGRPQLLTGSASADFSTAPTLNLELSSRWLDFDRLSGEPVDAGPLPAAQALVRRITSLQPDLFSKTDLKLRVDQATLSGSPVSGVAVDASTADGELELRRLAALLPGSSQVHLDGRFKPVDTADGGEAGASRPMRFEGHLLVAGTNAARFASWLGQGLREAQVIRAVDFFVRSEVETRPQYAALKNAILRVGDAQFSGDLAYGWGAARQLSISLSGNEIDLSSLYPDALSDELIARILQPPFAPGGTETSAPLQLDLAVDAGVLRDASRSLRDVAVEVARTSDSVTIRRLRLRANDGLTISATGEISSGGGTQIPAIRLDGAVAIRSQAGREQLTRILGNFPTQGASALAGYLPIGSQLAYKFVQTASDSNVLSLALDGSVDRTRLRVELTADEGWDRLSDAVVDVGATAEAQSSRELLASLGIVDGDGAGLGPVADGDRALLTLVAKGTPKAGLLVHSDLQSGEDTIAYRGNVALNTDNQPELAGRLTIEGSDVRAIAALADPLLGSRLPERPVEALIEVSGTASDLGLKFPRMTIGDIAMAGDLRRSVTADGNSRFSGEARISALRLGDLVGSIVDTDIPIATPLPERPTSPVADLWPAGRFQPELLTRYNLDLTVGVSRLELVDQVALSDARFRLEAGDRGVAVRDLTADGTRGGVIAASLDVSTDGAGVSVAGRLAANDVPYAAGPDDPRRASSGAAALSVSFNGRGLSPRALVTVLRGEGEVVLGDGELYGLAPSLVPSVAATFLVNPELSMDDLPKAILESRDGHTLSFDASRHIVTIKDGTLQVDAIRQETPRGVAENRTTVDLARLQFDSVWRLIPEFARAELDRTLPPVELIYVGSLSNIADTIPTVRADALAREIVVRRLEGNVEELERLRRLDEERAREEAERRELRGVAPDPAPQGTNGSGTQAPASRSSGAPPVQGFDREPIVRPAVPELLAPPVMQVPLPLPEEPRQRSEAPDQSQQRREAALEKLNSVPDFGMMRLGTPVGPYDPVPGEAVGLEPQPQSANRSDTPFDSGIVDISTGQFTALEVPTPRLLGPYDAASILGQGRNRSTSRASRLPTPGSASPRSERSSTPPTRSRQPASAERAASQPPARRRARGRDWRLQALFPAE